MRSVALRVSGPVNLELVIENMSSSYHGTFNPFDGDLDVDYTVRNPGNVRLGAHPTLVVKDPIGRVVERRKLDDIAELLPGNAATYHQRVSGAWAEVRLSATVELELFRPQGVKGDLPGNVSATTHAWAIPWTVLLLIALGFLLFRLYRRYREARRPAAAGGPGGRTSGSPSGSPGGPHTRTARVPERV